MTGNSTVEQMLRTKTIQQLYDDQQGEIERLGAERDRQYQQNAAFIVRIAELEAERGEMIEALRRLVCRLIPGMTTPSERNAIDLLKRIAPEIDLG